MYFFCSVIGLCEFQFAAQPVLGAAFGSPADQEAAEAEFVAHTSALLLRGIEAPAGARSRSAAGA